MNGLYHFFLSILLILQYLKGDTTIFTDFQKRKEGTNATVAFRTSHLALSTIPRSISRSKILASFYCSRSHSRNIESVTLLHSTYRIRNSVHPLNSILNRFFRAFPRSAENSPEIYAHNQKFIAYKLLDCTTSENNYLSIESTCSDCNSPASVARLPESGRPAPVCCLRSNLDDATA